jgi:hypothetical protein
MKTPLTFGEGSDREWYIHDADENWIAEAVPNEPGEAEETARRIAACVNACDGLDTALLERIVALGGSLPRRLEAMTNWERSEAEKQRDDLTEAIRLTLDENGHLADGDVCTLKRLKDALAKVGAGTTAIEGHNASLSGPDAALCGRSARSDSCTSGD